jgi:SAM-dependent methyltransferase/uncharacterized protein YbaR (Trm112 family)
MRRSLVDLLVDPEAKTPLELEAENGEDIEDGVLRGAGGRTYPIRAGIPRFAGPGDPGQDQTEQSFAYKWSRRGSWGSDAMRRAIGAWASARYGFESPDALGRHLAERGRTLDVGCGAGQFSGAWLEPAWETGHDEWVGVDVSSAIDVAHERLAAIPRTHFVQADLARLPFAEATFDAVVAEGVLHHTPSTKAAFDALVPLLRAGGELLLYVYRRKAPIREFTDDYVRDIVSELSPDEAWEALLPMTKLARALAELHAEVEVPEDVPLLGIKAGRHDVQRLVYWHFAKLYWRDEYSLEENNHLQFDWYHPRYAHRHTEDELRGWCAEAGLEIAHLDVQESGLTLRALRA